MEEDLKQENIQQKDGEAIVPTTEGDAVSIKTVGEAARAQREAETQRLIAEAEHRGYLRGVNEQIEKRMAQPGLLEIAVEDGMNGKAAQCQILNAVHPCVWDL